MLHQDVPCDVRILSRTGIWGRRESGIRNAGNRCASGELYNEHNKKNNFEVCHFRTSPADKPRRTLAEERNCNHSELPHNGRFLRHRFSPKPKSVATPNTLPKRNHVAKQAVSAAWQTKTRQRSERICKPNDAPKTKPRPCVKTMLHDPDHHDSVGARPVQYAIVRSTLDSSAVSDSDRTCLMD